MHVLVTGASGFIGQRVVKSLELRGYCVTCTYKSRAPLAAGWGPNTKWVKYNLETRDPSLYEFFGHPDAVCHLAWPDLTNYHSLAHIEKHLLDNIAFLKSLIDGGLKHLLVAGTCLEYGKVNGCLDEKRPSNPVVPYAIAKDTLRRYLIGLGREQGAIIQWARIFYIFGDGMRGGSLFGQLQRAIETPSVKSFKMSAGHQLRDYLPVDEVARRLAVLVSEPSVTGIINLCSGHPVSIRTLVEETLKKYDSELKLELGSYDIPSYEALAFWGKSDVFGSSGELLFGDDSNSLLR